MDGAEACVGRAHFSPPFPARWRVKDRSVPEPETNIDGTKARETVTEYPFAPRKRKSFQDRRVDQGKAKSTTSFSRDGRLRLRLPHRTLLIAPNLSSRFNVICLTGKSDFPVQPFSKKYSALLVEQIISTSSRHPVPRRRGVGHRHERWDGLRWTLKRRRETGLQGGFP